MKETNDDMRTTIIIAILALLAMPLLAEDGAALFKAKCAMCHGPDGSGQTPVGKSLKVRNLGSADVQKQSDEELMKTILDGKNKMPANKGKLSEAELKALVAHIRTLKK
jgi:mono/diheme cytochrome c family protein